MATSYTAIPGTFYSDMDFVGTVTTIHSVNLDVTDNIITANFGELGSGVTLGTAGLQIDRGLLSNSLILWRESDTAWVVNNGSTVQTLASRMDSGSMTSTGIPFYNTSGGLNRLDTAAGFTYNSGTSILSVANTLLGNGTVLLPSIAFTSDPNTGLYRIGADSLGITTGGAKAIEITSTLTGENNEESVIYSRDIYMDTDTWITMSSDQPAGLGNYVWGIVYDSTINDYGKGFGIYGVKYSGTRALPTAVATQNVVLSLIGEGYDGVGYNDASMIRFVTGVTPWDATHHQMGIEFYATGSGVSAPLDLISTITAGYIINTVPIAAQQGIATDPGYTFSGDTSTGMYYAAVDTIGFSTNGVLRSSISNTNITNTVPIYAPNGSAATPAYAFSSNSDLGMYRRSSTSIGFATSGVERMYITDNTVVTTSPVQFSAWTASALTPSYSFAGDNATGIYQFAAQTIGFSAFGTMKTTIGPNAVTIDTGYIGRRTNVSTTPYTVLLTDYYLGVTGPASARTMTLPTVATATAGRIYVFHDEAGNAATFNIIIDGNGAETIDGAATVSITTNNGTITVLCTGTAWVTIGSSSGGGGGGGLPAADGTALLPTIGFASDPNTGFYHPVGADTVGLSTNGTLKFSVDTANVISTLQYSSLVGTANAPTYSFTGDLDTGIYRPAANTVGISTNTTLKLSVDTANVISTLAYFAPDGTAALPSYSFTNRPAAGLWYDSSNTSLTVEHGSGNIVLETNVFLIAPAGTAAINVGGGLTQTSTQIIGQDASNSTLSLIEFSGTSALAPHLTLSRSKNGGLGLFSLPAIGDALGYIDFIASTAVAFATTKSAEIGSIVGATVSGTIISGIMTFCTQNSAGTLTEAMRVTDAQQLLIGHTASINAGDNPPARVQIHGTTAAGASTHLFGWSVEPNLTFARGASGTPGTFTAVTNGTSLGEIEWAGTDGTDLSSLAARIACVVDGTVSATNVPSRFTFSTANSSGNITEALRINSIQGILVGDSTENATQYGNANYGMFVPSGNTIQINNGKLNMVSFNSNTQQILFSLSSAAQGLFPPAGLPAASVLGEMWFTGSNASGFVPGALIRAITEVIGLGGSIPTSLEFYCDGGGLTRRVISLTSNRTIRYNVDNLGNDTLIGGGANVSASAVTATSRIFVTRTSINASTALGTLAVTVVSAGVGFTVVSYNAAAATEVNDVSSFNWMIMEQ